MQYTELHLHDHFSNLDGVSTPVEYMARAKELGMTHLAQTNHGTLSGMRDFQVAAKEAGIVPIIGMEAYISPTDRFDRRAAAKRTDGTSVYNHIILLAQDETGLRTLMRLNEIAWTEGFYHKPRIDLDLLEDDNEGLIVLSGCLNGLLSKALDRDENAHAKNIAKNFQRILGDRFYIEVQNHNPPKINAGLLAIADHLGIPAVVTSDCHHARKEDEIVQEAMLILSTNPKIDRTFDFSRSQKMDAFERFNYIYPDRTMTFQEFELHLHSAEEHRANGPAATREDLLANTMEIASRIGEYPFPQGKDLLPKPEGDPDKLLEKLVRDGLKRLGLAGKPEYEQRLEEELAIIKSKVGFATYFIIVADIVSWARSQDILVGPGRGSAAGSLVCYALGITQADPIKYGLLFFRFIDPSRPDFPDIDIDFEDTRRHEVKEYARKKYTHVASIATFTEFADKGVVRDAARVFQVPLKDVNVALKRVDTWEEFLNSDHSQEFRRKYPEVVSLAEKLRGRYRGGGMHAGGVVISSEPIIDFAPIETATDPDDSSAPRVPYVAFDMDAVADIGLIKIDFLGLKTLSVIHDCQRNVKSQHGIDIDLLSIPLDDADVYRDLSNGHTKAIFQAEAAPYTALLIKMGVQNLDELSASTALVRPGAMNTIGPEYIARKHGEKAIRYDHDIMRSFTEETYGTIVYQEQVMLACTELAGMTMDDANKIRRIIGKKKDPALFEAYQEQFLEGASKHISRKRAEKLWHDFEAHAGYSFNKSHAVVYAMLTYWSAWLKHYYPAEFMLAALMSANRGNAKEKKAKVTDYLIEAKRLGLKVKLPHVQTSGKDFEIDDGNIRFGLTSVKFISDKLAGRLIDNRPYANYADLEAKVVAKGSGLNRRALAALNAVGAASFDDNPKTGRERDNFYEYLGIPAFEIKELEPRVKAKFRDLDEYSETGVFPVLAMVRAIKRGEGWARIDVVDSTGSAGIFANENTPLEAGNMYAFLVADNRIVRYATIQELIDMVPSAFINYLYASADEKLPEDKLQVISFRMHTTRAGKKMAYVVVRDDLNTLHSVMAFPKQYAKARQRCQEGAIIEAEVNETESGSLYFKEIM